jgi:cell wall-associated NlpC family hydrolase
MFRFDPMILKPVSGAALICILGGCSHGKNPAGQDAKIETAPSLIKKMQAKYAPDKHLAIYEVAVQKKGNAFVLTGEVDKPEAALETERAFENAGIPARNEITVLPAKEIEDRTWGISTLSVANGREEPEQKAELGTQILMGNTVRIWKRNGRWFLAQSRDGYLSWVERGSIVRCSRAEADNWEHSPLVIVTAMEEQILERPDSNSQPVSDIVLANLLKKIGEQDNWIEVQLPDGRKGFVAKKAVEDFETWKQSRRAAPENVEAIAKLFLGRPYLWGGNSPKGLDCSGFTKMVFYMNGIGLSRNASHQALQGAPVPLDDDLANLKKGDLLFFGWGGRRQREPRKDEIPRVPRVSHVAIYLGDKTFIQSSQRVRVSSLDPSSPFYDEQYGRSLVGARRLLQ